MKYPCENCKLRAAYDKNPKSLVGRFWCWQINFCPSWRGCFESLPSEKQLNKYEKGQKYHGQTKLLLNNNIWDATQMFAPLNNKIE